MAKSSRKSRKQERQDARPFAHQTGRWAKKCRGQLVYLGRVADDPTGDLAWQKWLDIRDDLRAGRKPRPKVDDTLTVESLANLFLDAKKARVASGELTQRTWEDYQQLLVLVVETLGRTRAASDIGPDDWAKLRAVFASKWGPWRLANAVVYTKGAWKWAFENGLLASPMRFGSGFNRPNAKTMRANKNAAGDRTFKPDEVHRILAVASPNMKAALLLGLNCGYGTGDIAGLPLSALDLVNGWAEFPRPKTAIRRRCPLWAETVEAVKEALAARPTPRPGCEQFVFLRSGVKSRGERYTGRSAKVAVEFAETCQAAGVNGKTFYDARRSFQTVAETSKDFPATSAVMGHVASGQDMSAVYRQRIGDDRLRAVVETVRRWLFGQDDDGDRKPGDGDRQHGRKGTQQAQDGTAVQKAVIKCLQAIENASGPDKAVLQSVWNSSEIALALSGDTYTVQRFLSTWGDRQDERPALRVVG